ncbi:MAG: hypothetical protein IT281_06820 [Ignavibacteria bacterium]|nr:hypothetical protein [Ignavibacteria bacterium]MCC7159232.1 hypothetical protein [Ignavibacteria bacterium]
MEPTTPPAPPVDSGKSQEDLSVILKIVSFCIPLVGAIIWFLKKDKEPKAAKSACTFALIGFAVGIIINVLVTVLNS